MNPYVQGLLSMFGLADQQPGPTTPAPSFMPPVPSAQPPQQMAQGLPPMGQPSLGGAVGGMAGGGMGPSLQDLLRMAPGAVRTPAEALTLSGYMKRKRAKKK